MKNILFILLFISQTINASELSLYNFDEKRYVSQDEFLEKTQEFDRFVFGEFHYHVCIQKAEAQLIEIISKSRQEELSVGMEFLDYEKQAEIDYWSIEYFTGAIGLRDYTFKLLGESDKNLRYAPMLRDTILNNGQILGTNSPRDIKARLMRDGYDSIPEKYKLEELFEGSTEYYQRFKKAMQGHASEEEILKYFSAQVYTDNYIAEKFINKSKNPVQIQIIGAFHADYFDGFVNQYSKRTNRPIASIKFVSKNEMKELIESDSRYGVVSNYLVGCDIK